MELTYAIITPRSLAKSRTGAIIARLLAEPGLEFVGARMYAPSEDFVDKYLKIMETDQKKSDYTQTYMDYINHDLRAATALESGYCHRFLALFFKGENARKRLYDKVIGGHFPPPSGTTIRGAFGDYAAHPDGTIQEFHPAVLGANSPSANTSFLKLLAEYAEKDGGVVESAFPDASRKQNQTTLVMIKPDNFARPSTLPGHIIDMFGTTGLYLVGAKLFHMSVNQAIEFYGFLEDVFVERLKFLVEKRLRKHLAGAFPFELSDVELGHMADLLKHKNAHAEVSKIIEYMTGIHPDTVRSATKRRRPGPARCLALLYRGENAISKIRTKLGATDPLKAAAGTIRSDYGHDLMRNGAHASDSPESAERERRIIGLLGTEKSDEKKLIRSFLRSGSA